MQALSSLPSPNSDTSNSHALAVLSNEEEKMKSPVSRILQSNVTCHEQEDRRTILLLYPGGVALVHEEALAGGHVPLPDGGVRPARDHEGVLHRHAVDVAAVTPGMKQREANFLCNVTCAMTHLSTPMHSVSSVLVAHILAVASSLPVTSMEPSSDTHMQLMLSSWSAIVSSRSPCFPVEPPAPMVRV